MSHDPSEIILICWFIICWNCCAASYCFLEHVILIFLMNTKLKRAAFVQNRNIFYSSIFAMTFYSFNTSLLNKSIHFFKKKRKNGLTPNFWIALYIVTEFLYIFWYIVTQNYFLNICCFCLLFINQRILKKKNITGPKKILSSTTVSNIDYKSAY